MPFTGDSTDSSEDESSKTKDYCFPPDSLCYISDEKSGASSRKGSTDSNKKVLKTCATYTTVSLKKVNSILEKLTFRTVVLRRSESIVIHSDERLQSETLHF